MRWLANQSYSGRAVALVSGTGCVKARGRSQYALEHAGKCGGAAVAELEGNRCDRLTACQSWNGLQHGGASLPIGKTQARLAPERARERASAHRQSQCPCIDGLGRRGAFEKV